MNKWLERFNQHPARAMLKSLLQELETEHRKSKLTPDDWSRFHDGAIHIQQCLIDCLPQFVAVDTLNGIAGNLNTLIGEFTNFDNSNDGDRINAAHDALDRAIKLTKSLPMPHGDEPSVGSIISSLSSKIDTILQETNDKKNEIERQYNDLKIAMSALQNDLQGTANILKNEQATTISLSAEYQKQFSEQQENRRKEFADKITWFQSKIEDHIRNLSETFDEEKNGIRRGMHDELMSIRANVDDLLKSLKDKDSKASKLLEAVGIKSHTYGYAGATKKEGDAANWLRLFAIIFMIMAVAILIGPALLELFHAPVDFKFDWYKILYRIPTSIIVFIPAFYMAREASRHRTVEVENKRMELELAALTPYLELFDDEKKNKIKEELVKNYFIGHSQQERKEDEELKLKWMQEMVPEVIQKVLDKILDRLPYLNRPNSG